MQLFLVPYNFFILLLEKMFVQVQALQHCNKGSQVPACLSTTQSNLQIQCNPYQNTNDIYTEIEQNLKIHMEPQKTL